MPFLDTNILLYAISSHPAEAEKTHKAKAILNGTDITLSVQVLQEFYVQSTRPTRPDPLSHQEATALIQHWLRHHIIPLNCQEIAFSTSQFSRRPRGPWGRVGDEVEEWP